MNDIYAIQPDSGSVIHLHKPGYQPGGRGTRTRPKPDRMSLCNVYIHREAHIPLADAHLMRPTGTDPRDWKWCRHCLGHLVVLAGLETLVLTMATGGVVDPPRQPVKRLPQITADQIHRATSTMRSLADGLDRLAETP